MGYQEDSQHSDSQLDTQLDTKKKRSNKYSKKSRKSLLAELRSDKELFWKVVRRTVIFSLLMVGSFILVKVLFADELYAVGEWLTNSFGQFGMVVYTFFVDMFILPATMDILFVFVTDVNPIKLALILGTASIAGGCVGYWLARSFNHLSVIERMTYSFRVEGEDMLHRYGGWAVFAAALTPLPFSTIMWIAGLLKVPFYEVFLGSLARIPRVFIYYYLIQSGVILLQ